MAYWYTINTRIATQITASALRSHLEKVRYESTMDRQRFIGKFDGQVYDRQNTTGIVLVDKKTEIDEVTLIVRMERTGTQWNLAGKT
jgi:hypothetical protein